MEADVTFDYEAQAEDELTLKVGDVITDIKQHDDGWCEGTLRGRKGVFPDNFVQFRTPKAPEVPKVAAVPEMRGMELKSKVRRAKVAYSYSAENPDELSLLPGQVVEVIAEEEAGWWKGVVGGKTGVFPSNFVEEILEESKPEPQKVDTKPPIPDAGAKLPISVAPIPVTESKPAVVEPSSSKPAVETSKASVVETKAEETDASSEMPKIGLKVMPAFDPSKIKLKPSSGSSPAPPPSTGDSKKPSRALEKAKIVADHAATRTEELDVKTGDIVDVVKKDSVPGFWEVRIGDKSGLIPDTTVELQIPGKKPLPKEPPKLPFKKATDPPKPAVTILETETTSDLTESFGVPPTVPLDTTVLQNRPKHLGRPPSTTKLPGMDAATDGTPVVVPPWKEEMRKKKTLLPPPPSGATVVVPGPSVSSGPASNLPTPPAAVATAGPPAPPKPKPPTINKPDIKAPQTTSTSEKSEQEKTLQEKLEVNMFLTFMVFNLAVFSVYAFYIKSH